uniref:Protein SDA1 n=1 Tax=Ditylenchus dipsaci TaxID=166011 RepID=A0A915DZJ1_9BILA
MRAVYDPQNLLTVYLDAWSRRRMRSCCEASPNFIYLHRYLQPKQKEVTRILLYAAQACHPLVPPDVVEQLVRVIAQNFVTDRNSNEAMTVGLTLSVKYFPPVRLRPLKNLLRDLAEYKTFKNKNVPWLLVH